MQHHLAVVSLPIPSKAAQAQWLNYRTPGTPRTPDGNPILAARAPKAPDGKPTSPVSGCLRQVLMVLDASYPLHRLFLGRQPSRSGRRRSSGSAGVWYFIDVYYPGTQSFNFHFTDPPGSGTLAPMPFSLVEQNYLAGGTPVGSPQGFSLTINPDGTIQDVNVTGMALTGPGVGTVTGVPEPALGVLITTLLAAMAGMRRRSPLRSRPL